LLATIEDYDTWQVDHVAPISKGGDQSAFDNLAVACKLCNFIKRNWEPVESGKLRFDRATRIAAAWEIIREKRTHKGEQLAKMRSLIAEFLAARRRGEGLSGMA
jgi:5-methylcytosine-specific restriction endonuclease McrA